MEGVNNYYNKNLTFCAATDIGRQKENNEDTFIAQFIWASDTVLLAVIDGVGGYDGGEVAAYIAQKEICNYLDASSNGERVELLKQAVTVANNAIFESRKLQCPQMSCVLSSVIVDTQLRQISMAHVGDTRVYQFWNGELKKLSHDHSPIGYREEIGDLTEEEAMNHPNRNLIQRDLGSEKHRANDKDFIEAQTFPLLPMSTILLCSDGLTDLVTSAEIVSVLEQAGTSLEQKVRILIDTANEKGGKDNVTVVLAQYIGEEEESEIVETQVDYSNENNQTQPNENEEITDNESVTEELCDTNNETDSNKPQKEEERSGSCYVRTALIAIFSMIIGFAIGWYCRSLNEPVEEKNNELSVGSLRELYQSNPSQFTQKAYEWLEQNPDSVKMFISCIGVESVVKCSSSSDSCFAIWSMPVLNNNDGAYLHIAGYKINEICLLPICRNELLELKELDTIIQVQDSSAAKYYIPLFHHRAYALSIGENGMLVNTPIFSVEDEKSDCFDIVGDSLNVLNDSLKVQKIMKNLVF